VEGYDEDEIVRMRIHRTRRGLMDLDIGLQDLGSMNCHVRPMAGGLWKRSRKRAVTATLNRGASVNACVDVFFGYLAGKMVILSAQIRRWRLQEYSGCFALNFGFLLCGGPRELGAQAHARRKPLL
jgi:hypothetical protein